VNLDLSNPADVALQIWLLILAFVISVRYGYFNPNGDRRTYWWSLPLTAFLAILAYVSSLFFLGGTAAGTGLEHPIYVIFYLIGGACVLSVLDWGVKAFDKWLIDITTVHEDE